MAPPAAGVVARLRAAGCVFAEDEARLLAASADSPAELARLVDRRVAGLPLEQVLGWAEFCGLRVAVEPGVFVPRRRTEFLVRRAVALARRGGAPGSGGGGPTDVTEPEPAAGPVPVVVDLCCGSGAVGLAIAAALGPVELHAVDVDPAAVRCARRNLAALGGTHGTHGLRGTHGTVYRGDLDAPLSPALRGRVDLLVANVPYVPTGELALLPAEARLHEPTVALDGGLDGLAVLRRVAAAATRWLAPGGHLLIETGERQAPAAAEAFARHGLTPTVLGSADDGATVVVGTPAQRSR